MLNKRYGYDFTHHISREYVQYLHIEGDVKIAYITYKPGPVKNNVSFMVLLIGAILSDYCITRIIINSEQLRAALIFTIFFLKV